MIGLRADHDIDFAGPARDFCAFSLGDTAGNRDHRRRSIIAPHPANIGIDLLGCLFANMAGVEHNEIGRVRVIGGRQSLGVQKLGHAFAVIDVHLAAKAFDEIAFRIGSTHGARL